jgi:methyltransferase (TIGR00027 family)
MDIQERPASRTAVAVAILRALHELCDDSPKILSDPVIPMLLDGEMVQKAKASPEWLHGPRAMALRSHVVLRSRYAEDCLHDAVDRGVRQYVILGSGLDTFAYRQPEWAAPLRIFEIDHAASQRTKVERLRASGISIPSNLELVAADFETSSLRDILSASSLDFSAPAFFACLGVLVYLPAEVVQSMFRLVTSFPITSEIVFTFSQGGVNSLAQDAAAAGEPWRSYYDPEALGAELSSAGFSQVTFLSPETAKELYYRDRSDALPPPRRITIGRAVV